MGSLTQTVTPTGGGTEGTVDEQLRQPVGILTLRGAAAPEAERRGGIRWAGDVIDNEGMGKKKSKVLGLDWIVLFMLGGGYGKCGLLRQEGLFSVPIFRDWVKGRKEGGATLEVG
ncbi:MAG: hypothetical protein M1836_001552 [Candelina mexicana]|nr:MAG: hypothetical protein M1836_001552 [Candelina mexicana]